MLHTNTDLNINISRRSNGEIGIDITSDYVDSNRKGQLYVNKKRIQRDVENIWRSVKTTKKVSMRLDFFEIDWYDGCDSFEVPTFLIGKGLKKARISTDETNTIPKDWGVSIFFRIKDTTTKTPVLDVVKNVLCHLFTTDDEKTFTKQLKPFLQKKTNNMNFYKD